MNTKIIQAKAAQLRSMINTLPVMAGDTAIQFIHQRYREQAWVNNGTEPWKPRKIGAKRNKGRAILINTGRLRRGWRISRTTHDAVTIANDVPYAQAHNDGYKGVVQVKQHVRTKWKKSKVETGKLTKTGKKSMKTITQATGTYSVRAHTKKMNMPRRRMIGDSAILNKQIKRLIDANMNKIFKN